MNFEYTNKRLVIIFTKSMHDAVSFPEQCGADPFEYALRQVFNSGSVDHAMKQVNPKMIVVDNSAAIHQSWQRRHDAFVEEMRRVALDLEANIYRVTTGTQAVDVRGMMAEAVEAIRAALPPAIPQPGAASPAPARDPSTEG